MVTTPSFAPTIHGLDPRVVTMLVQGCCIFISFEVRIGQLPGPMSCISRLKGKKYCAKSAISAPPYGALIVIAPRTLFAIACARCTAYIPPRLCVMKYISSSPCNCCCISLRLFSNPLTLSYSIIKSLS